MLHKPSDYDQAMSYDSDFARLPVGGYVCRILKMEESTSRNGQPYVIVFFDIAEGEQKDFFEKLYRRDKSSASREADAKWRGTYNLFPLTRDGLTNPSFKGMMSCIEKSNDCQVDWHSDYNQFKGRLVGLMFREEEFEHGTGSRRRVGVAVRPFAARTVDFIRSNSFDMPRRRTLSDKAYTPAPVRGANGVRSVDSGPDQEKDAELPF